MPRPCLTLVAVVAALLAVAGGASAQPALTFKTPKKGAISNLSPVVAPAARSVALSEPLGLLAFGHDRTYPDAHLSLVRLDMKGLPAPYATSCKFPPLPPVLEKLGVYATGLAFHPKLPLLYVWRDVAQPYQNVPAPPELLQFDHLLVYNVAQQKPALLMALCRGTDYFMFGQEAGAPGVDPAGEFLYVPNLHEGKTPGHIRFGRYPLDSDGLPALLGDKDGKLPADQRVKKLAEKNAAGPLVPPEVTPIEYTALFPYTGAGTGSSYLYVARDAILVGGSRGLILWRPTDKNCTVAGLPLKGATHTLLVSHPALPLAFATVGTDSAFRIEHVEGIPTMVPQQWIFPEKVQGRPAVFDKGHKLAVGGRYVVYVVPLDEKGRSLTEAAQVRVFNPAVQTLVYSARFDRLYVSVEVSK